MTELEASSAGTRSFIGIEKQTWHIAKIEVEFLERKIFPNGKRSFDFCASLQRRCVNLRLHLVEPS